MNELWLAGAACILLLLLAVAVGGGNLMALQAPVAALVEPALSLATTWVVNSTLDAGPGSLRQALLDAQTGDTITFDPAFFPPGTPATITLTSGPLPALDSGGVTIEVSNTIDALPSVVLDTQPLSGTANVAPSVSLVITFSEAVEPTSLDLALVPATPITPTWNGASTVVTAEHALLASMAAYTATAAAADLVGNPMAEPLHSQLTPGGGEYGIYLPLVLRR